jgi:hypothetical protein
MDKDTQTCEFSFIVVWNILLKIQKHVASSYRRITAETIFTGVSISFQSSSSNAPVLWCIRSTTDHPCVTFPKHGSRRLACISLLSTLKYKSGPIWTQPGPSHAILSMWHLFGVLLKEHHVLPLLTRWAKYNVSSIVMKSELIVVGTIIASPIH